MNALRLPILVGCLQTKPAKPSAIHKFLLLSGAPVGNTAIRYLRGRCDQTPWRGRPIGRVETTLARILASSLN
ncbi:MAG: hypothetical protein KME03_04115 [Aphanocapsa lilacina HA4352-LM1]|jgi:hypothetical protein|uniref:Gsr0186 protein n=2 Tax=Gloeobacter TaxID=33071 RepID=Q7NP71_GLOVI|nr:MULTISPECIES: hypothetical protein [Gloeobacter]MBW4697081.1 hypothetical protein [Aphanocapsa lilacina HA4352-LM1]UFP95835.1 hypothetical protein ISF26_06270 [Gloeobacter morelensis MG652769]BAC88127.1 gsr0186 [Gloeobacter violaceus PCC 7421]